jgi:hypothetical protein
LGGATAGFNYQFSSLLIGIEGDLGAMEIGGSKADPLGATESTTSITAYTAT